MTTKKLLEHNTLSSQVQNYILELIPRENLTAGMAVPSEMQIIQDLGVSRGVVRESYRSLSALGVLEIKSGKVPRIKHFDASVLQLIFGFASATEQVTASQILSVRRWLEIGCAEMAAVNGTEQDFALLQQEMRLIRENFHNTESFVEHDIHFHLVLSQASKNPLFMILLQALHAQLKQSVYAGLEAQKEHLQYEQRIVELHQKICDFVCTRDAENAKKAMMEHFDTAVNSLIEQGSEMNGKSITSV
ncbi:FadR/GntR family transcriptional regulator [Sodalis ligni]|uniref:GntR family transcriptional regulator n=1 Tax=Sodalis ligni TaxID=2697027 RepID=A0A4R1NC44_9GAMM|nr:FadR/GntR family transcriptional regulator [Sodalis ligni]TCL04319.1 GntR family transcriptional regulator [Sodalis ligni]